MELKAVFKIFQLRPGTIKNLHLGSLYRLESPKNQNSKVGPKNGLGSKGLKNKKITEKNKQKYPDTRCQSLKGGLHFFKTCSLHFLHICASPPIQPHQQIVFYLSFLRFSKKITTNTQSHRILLFFFFLINCRSSVVASVVLPQLCNIHCMFFFSIFLSL